MTVVAGELEGPLLATVTVYVVDWPGTAEAALSLLVTTRSARGVRVSTSVAALFATLVSVTPSGAATVAELVNEPVAEVEIAAVTVKVTEPPTGRLTLLLIEPLPDAGHVAPPAPVHVHVIDVTPEGIVSATVAPVTVDGPALVATIVYVVDWPGTAVTVPSVFVIVRSVWGVTVVTSVAELLAGVGSVTDPGSAMLAVLVIVPVADATTVPEMVKVAVPPGASVTEAARFPLPEAGHVEPAVAEHVQVEPLNEAGMVSLTVAAVTVEGPGLVATTV